MSETYTARQKPGSKIPTLSEVMKVVNPTAVLTPEPAPPPVYSVPRMSLGLQTPPPNAVLKVMRVGQADVDELTSWAEGKFLDRWPDLSVAHLGHFARMGSGRNDYGAFRTLEAWGVVNLLRHPFEPAPIAELMFLISKRPVHAELEALLRTMISWSKSAQATEFRISKYVDFDLAPVLKKFGNFQADSYSFLRLK